MSLSYAVVYTGLFITDTTATAAATFATATTAAMSPSRPPIHCYLLHTNYSLYYRTIASTTTSVDLMWMNMTAPQTKDTTTNMANKNGKTKSKKKKGNKLRFYSVILFCFSVLRCGCMHD